ncbi:hypothetical protein ACQP1K_15065 [Sphaerimonospora sp. CA-214678]|uniref:hypothetical protein n=1 Tax=Sphaerimonospora sp. CA-214678 TaxID=3240029 RepID=UPI003D935878
MNDTSHTVARLASSAAFAITLAAAGLVASAAPAAAAGGVLPPPSPVSVPAVLFGTPWG